MCVCVWVALLVFDVFVFDVFSQFQAQQVRHPRWGAIQSIWYKFSSIAFTLTPWLTSAAMACPPIPTPPSPSTPGYTKSDGDPPLFSTPGYTNALAIHAPLASIWTQSIDPAIIMRIRIETAKVRAIFKWVCRISMIGGKQPKMTNIWIILNVWWYQCGFWVWGTFSIKYGFHSRCCWFCRCYVTLCATSDAYSRLVFDQIHQIRKYFTPEINLTVWGWYLQIICTRSVWSNQQPTSPITLYSIKEESILSLWGDHLHLHRENLYTFHSAHSERANDV